MKKLKTTFRLQVWHIGVLLSLISIFFIVSDWTSFVVNSGTTFFSMGFTILIIDRLVQNHERRNLRASLISQMRSEHNILATDAVRRIRDEGWENGLKEISLWYANLENAQLQDFNLRDSNLTYGKFNKAHLSGACLNNATIHGTDFSDAWFHRAFLIGASLGNTISQNNYIDVFKNAHFCETNLTGAKFLGIFDGIMSESEHPFLQVASTLEGSTMPNGRRYDGRYNLEGDLNQAAVEHDTSNPFAMAEFYRVSVDEYMQGQLWKKKYDDYLLSREAIARDICKEQGWNWDEMNPDERGRFLDVWYKEP